MDGQSGEPDKDMTRQQNSSSAAFSILTASRGEEWTARKKMTGVEITLEKTLKPQFPSTSLIAQQKARKLQQAEMQTTVENSSISFEMLKIAQTLNV